MLLFSQKAFGQASAAIGVGYHDQEEVGRWGVMGSILIPINENHFDLSPNFEYYYSKWSVGSETAVRDVYIIALDAHANLPELASRLRPYIGAGVAYAGHGDEGAFGVNLATGFYIRVIGWSTFPFGHVSYRVLPEFEEIGSLDTYFFRGGVRVAL